MNLDDRHGNFQKAILYFILCTLFWIIIDFGTAGGFRLSYFEKYGPALLLFYIGYPVIFTFLIFILKLGGKGLFLATLIGIFIVEVLFTGNPLITGFPVCLIGIPLAVAVYSPLTFFPLWIVNREMGRHIKEILVLSFIEVTILCLTTFGSGN